MVQGKAKSSEVLTVQNVNRLERALYLATSNGAGSLPTIGVSDVVIACNPGMVSAEPGPSTPPRTPEAPSRAVYFVAKKKHNVLQKPSISHSPQ